MPPAWRRKAFGSHRKDLLMRKKDNRAMPADLGSMAAAAKAHVDAGRLEAAASLYEELVRLAPADANVQHTLGLVYLELDRIDEALFHIGRSLELNPANAAACRSMGDALDAANQFGLAIRSYEKACALDPENTDARLNLGNAWHALDMFDLARRAYLEVIARAPDHQRALNNLGKVYHDLGELDSALFYYDRCIAGHPDYAEARFNRATLLLARGDFQRGWPEYEWRFKRSGAAHVYPHRLSAPRWRGEDFKGRRLLVHGEQGMGDVLQFVRYLPLVKARGGRLIMEAHAPLARLLQGQPWIDDLVVLQDRRPPQIPFDLQIPLLSLPAVFDTRAETIPDATPYLKIDPAAAGQWKAWLPGKCFNIGLVWASSDLNPKRNLPLKRCTAWFQNPRLRFIGLQKGAAAGQLLKHRGHSSQIAELGPHLNDFLDTAAIMSGLDLIISVDTAAAHLAGAMDRPLWVLLPSNPDWRWLSGSKSSAWYPNARLFRQSGPGDWDSTIDQVAAALRRLPPAASSADASACQRQ
jgi:tetratricopeptide (TPR) repeat protein